MATNKRDYYEVLGVSKEATEDELKKAYRKLAKENHPDLHPGDKACEERFKEINEAYEILSDPEKKQLYDQYGHAAFDPNAGPYGPGGFGDLGDIFGDIFGGFGFGDIFGGGGARRSNGPRKGESIRTNISISFEEAAFGCKKDISVARVETCADCSGSGAKPGTQPETCPNCKGTGAVRTTQRTPLGMVQSSAPCQQCHGTGKIVKDPCNTCHGMGKIRKQHKINVTIPAGIDDGQTVSLRGQGNAGSNGGPAGDLLVYVIVRPDARFEREGSDVLLEQLCTGSTGRRDPDSHHRRKGEAEYSGRNTDRIGIPAERKGNPVSERFRPRRSICDGASRSSQEPHIRAEGTVAEVLRIRGRNSCKREWTLQYFRKEETLISE